jgi:prevent-host-death family protein
MLANIVEVHEAAMSLAQLLERATAGEAIIIAKNGVPVVRLVAVEASAVRRSPGGWDGRVEISADFDAPLPAELLAAFRCVTARI